MPVRSLIWFVAPLVVAAGVGRPASAEDAGQDDFDRAIEAKLSAETLAELTAAIDLYESALKKGLGDENAQRARELLGGALYERASQLSGPLLEGRFEFQAAQRWRRAVSDLERAIELSPELASAHLLLGKLQALPVPHSEQQMVPKGDPVKALQALNEAIRLLDDDKSAKAEALVERARLRKVPAERLADLSEAVELAPQDPKPLRERGRAYVAQGKAAEASADFEAALALDPNDYLTLEAQAMAQALLEKWGDARATLDRAVELAPKSAEPLVERGRINFMAGDHQAAMSDLNAALRIDPNDLSALLAHAQVLAEEQKWDLALADAERLLDLQPGLIVGVQFWAWLIIKSEKLDETIARLERTRQRHPDDVVLLVELGLLYPSAHNTEKAVEAYGAALERDPDSWFAHQGRADALLSAGRQQEAIDDYERALELSPENNAVLNNLAWLLATSPDDALRDGRRAVKLATRACELTDYKQAHILSTLAAAHAETGDFDEARKWSAAAVELGDDSQKEQLCNELASYEEEKPWRELQTQPAEAPAADAMPAEENSAQPAAAPAPRHSAAQKPRKRRQ